MPSHMRDADMKRFSKVCSSFEGREAIYLERPGGIIHIRVNEVSVDPAGVNAVSTDLLTPGMNRSPQNPFKVGYSWGFFSHSADIWDVPNIMGWRMTVHFDAGALKGILKMADEAHQKNRTVNLEEAKLWLSNYRFG